MALIMRLPVTIVFGSVLAACTSSPEVQPTGTNIGSFEAFTPARSGYRLIPGDQLEITLHAVPDLSRMVTVGPDGRIAMPLVQPIMVADLTIPQAQQVVTEAMSMALVDPRLDLSVTTYAPQRVFVGGEVGMPGVMELPGQIDALQAIIMAGGFTDSSNMKQVILIRRNPGGPIENYSFNIKQGVYNPQLAKLGALQNFDVIYVPKTPIAQQNLFIQQYIRNALPIDFNIAYNIGNRNY